MKKKVFGIVCVVLLVIIGTIVVKVRTDARNELAKEARSQKEKDAEVLDDRINNPQTPEDYYEAFLAGKIKATTTRTGVFQRYKMIDFVEMKTELGASLGVTGWPNKVQMASYSIVKPDEESVPLLVLRMYFAYPESEEYVDNISIFKYIGDGNIRMIGQAIGINVKRGSRDISGSVRVLTNGIVEEHNVYNHSHGLINTGYYNMFTDDKTFECIAFVSEYDRLASCIIPASELPSSIAGDNYTNAAYVDEGEDGVEYYNLQKIETDYINCNSTDDYYKQGVYFVFRDKSGKKLYPADSTYASLYEEHGINIITSDKANTLLEDVFAEHGYDYNTCLDAPEIEWIDIECPPWGPYN